MTDSDDVTTLERLRECFTYDAATGVLRWKIRASTHVYAGDEAGCFDARGYCSVRVDRRMLLVHRVAWALHYGAWPERDIDHKDTDKSNNRIANLRLATRVQNIANMPSWRSMPKGCYQIKGRRRWYSQIKVDGKARRLGTFDTAAEAAEAFSHAHKILHGEYSRCEAR